MASKHMKRAHYRYLFGNTYQNDKEIPHIFIRMALAKSHSRVKY